MKEKSVYFFIAWCADEKTLENQVDFLVNHIKQKTSLSWMTSNAISHHQRALAFTLYLIAFICIVYYYFFLCFLLLMLPFLVLCSFFPSPSQRNIVHSISFSLSKRPPNQTKSKKNKKENLLFTLHSIFSCALYHHFVVFVVVVVKTASEY